LRAFYFYFCTKKYELAWDEWAMDKQYWTFYSFF